MANISRGNPWSQTATGTTSASVTYTAAAGQLLWVTDFSASSTGTAGTWTIAITGGATLWQGSGAVNYTFSTPLAIGKGNGLTVTANGVTATYLSVGGYEMNFG